MAISEHLFRYPLTDVLGVYTYAKNTNKLNKNYLRNVYFSSRIGLQFKALAVQHLEAVAFTRRVANAEAVNVKGKLSSVARRKGPLHCKTRWGILTLFFFWKTWLRADFVTYVG